MLDDIGHIRLPPLDAGLRERIAQETAGGADKWMPCTIFFVARLLADEHDVGGRLPLAEDRLRCVPPEMAGLAAA